ncbi:MULTISPECIES: tyrosine-type DNA invertase [Serratia]|jgi:type 1 fimbriae regulatory protein FimB|uniref:tyrosine-type DNA invertase n=1 Tax=Serratia TaxID=613 RepID=UPI0008FD4224|nr:MULTISPECIES: tyrosine-type DNA invertase [Serratia]MBC3250081.1 tyrosine-type recombinase/integrase [Serratia fonticola]MBE0151667.1 tyrosine-type recombinase/integrase [Serratia fonticola]MDQ7210088.1 tyrosine-type DNA invertase [Serratia fonticola]NXZ85451.1 tyrosine-type recombinase/integrase [Serratia fonticola]OIX93013.1 DNA recombinase [Serratia fonticola]
MNNRKHLTPSEVARLLGATQQGKHAERDYCLIWMCFIHGCRVSEINRWRLSDIDLEGKSIYIHRLKNGFSTIHPLYAKEHKALRAWLKVRRTYRGADSDWLFLSEKGNHLSRQRIYWLMRNYSELAGLEVNAHPHMLRHGCGFALADRGIDTRLIQDFLGHKNIQHTVLYTASNARRFKEVW